MRARATTFIAVLLPVATSLGGLGCQQVPPRPLAPERTAAAFAARSLAAPELATFLAAARGAPVEWPLRTWDLRTLTLAALYFQPQLEVVRAHADVAAAAIETAGARPNPTLSLAPQLSANPAGAISPWLAAVHFDWPIETAGKRARRLERADAAAAAARAAVVVEAWRVRRQVASALVALTAATRQRRGLVAEAAVDTRLVALLQRRLDVGEAAANDVAPLRLALLQTTIERAAADVQVDDALGRLAAAVGVPGAALGAVTLPEGLDAADAEALLRVSADDARRRALLERADVRQALAEYAAAEATLRLELARQYPDLRLGPTYEFDQGQNKWGLSLALDLPLLDRNQGPIAEAVAARAEAAAKLTATQAGVIAEVEQAVARRDGELARRAQVRALAAARDANAARAARGVALGAVDRVTELAAALEGLRAERAVAEAESALEQALVDLESAMEGPLPAVAVERPLQSAAIGGAT